MKRLGIAFLTLAILAQSVYAIGGLPLRLKFTTTSVSTSAFTELYGLIPKGISALSVSNSGSAPVQLAFGAAGSESTALIVPKSSTLIPVVYPIQMGYGQRLSVISLDQANSTGELEVNVLYN